MPAAQPLYGMGQPGASSGAPDYVDMDPRERRFEDERDRRMEAEYQERLRVQHYWMWLRGAVASRLIIASLRHADLAWQQRHRLQIAPLSVVLLYADPNPDGSHEPAEVKIAPKMFTQLADPLQMLWELTELAASVLAGGGDPRQEMSENPEPMTARAVYQGIALCSLDTPSGTWQDILARPQGQHAYSIPARVLTVLADQTLMLIDRREHREPNHCRVDTTLPLNPSWGGAGRYWVNNPNLGLLNDEATRDLWLRLIQLHQVLLGGGRHGL